MNQKNETKIALFENKEIRKTFYRDEWWFSVNDVISALTDSRDPAQYFRRLKERDIELAKLTDKGVVQFVPPLMLEVETVGGKQKAYCWNTEGIFRLIQSIPSSKAEPFKLWLAKVGYERVEEMEDPELAFDRAMKTYLQKGYSKEWINQRLKTIEVRKEYKEFKGLKKQNLRDNMSNLELTLNMLAEVTTTELHKGRDSKGMPELKRDANDGGDIAGNTRKEIEQKIGKKVLRHENYLELVQLKKKKLK